MIVILTDFGLSEYTGVMKGVIYSIHSDAKIVDLCHDISPQNLIEASWILKNNYKYFPKGTTFCCVVDPSVGTKRKALAVKTRSFYFVAPDNGLLWETLREEIIIAIKQIPIHKDASCTFHGRDVFAKAAARIDLGGFNEFSEEIEDIQKLEFYQNVREGIVVRIDRFGNIVTNLPAENKKLYLVDVADSKYKMNFYPTYDAAGENELFLIKGSNNTLEISLKNANAYSKLKVMTGQRIIIS